MRYLGIIAKAIAAVLVVLLGSGILTGHWLTETQVILSAVNGLIVYLVPNTRPVIAAAGDTRPFVG